MAREVCHIVKDRRPNPRFDEAPDEDKWRFVDGLPTSTWCGASWMGFCFQTAEHALAACETGINAVACPACLRAVREAIVAYEIEHHGAAGNRGGNSEPAPVEQRPSFHVRSIRKNPR